MRNKIRSLLKAQEGAETVEWVIVVAILVMAIVGGLNFLGQTSNNALINIAQQVSNATG
jgi:Flp pilus assembly pilin Flp